MQLETALRSSSLGIANHGKAISVVGDNISNVSTYGFKKNRAEFVDLFAEGSDGRSSVAGPRAGNGARVETIRAIHTTGIIEDTGRNLDVAIDGEGFLVVGDIENPTFTRSGILALDENGTLVDARGNAVLGFAPGLEEAAAVELGPLSVGDIDLAAVATDAATLGGVLSATAPISELPAADASLLDVGRSANFSYTMPVYDGLGDTHNIIVAFYKTELGSWTARGYIDAADVGGEAGQASQVSQDVILNFEENGDLVAGGNPQLVFNLPYTNGAPAGNITLDLTNFVQVAAPSAISTSTINGNPTAQVDGIEFDDLGNVNVVFADGRSQVLGTLGLADFTNVDGLKRAGDTQFVSTEAAGDLRLGRASFDGFGAIRPAALERSTVDISEEFVNMVVYQRGYEANSQTFSATSTLLQQTIQLIR